MSICAWTGYPDLFITFTCNPKWPEITRYIECLGLHPEDRPGIVSRVFKVKLDGLLKDLRNNKVFGHVRAVIYTVEFQKWGLPHAHILLFLDPADKMPLAVEIDRCISAEILDQATDPMYYDAVSNFMMHGPCGIANKSTPCMSKNKCKKYFPKEFVVSTKFDDEGFPIYKRTDNGRTIIKSGVPLDSRYVVPHNRYLLLKYGAHMNLEWCNQSLSIKYLFKYINKGNDRVTTSFYNSANDGDTRKNIDEINMYYDCRYISPCEAVWRIYGFSIHYKDPSVQRLSFHLSNEQTVYYSDKQSISNILALQSYRKTMFEACFEANKRFPQGNSLTYPEFPQRFVWSDDRREWLPRKKGFLLGRAYYVPPGSGERYYQRCLINVIRGAKFHRDMMVVNNVQYNSYKDACYALGIIEDDKEYVDAINEANSWASAHSLRRMFSTLIMEKCMRNPKYVWDKCWQALSDDDVLYSKRKQLNSPGLRLSEEELKNFALLEIENILHRYGGSLKYVDSMPYPNHDNITSSTNQLIHDEMQYDVAELQEQLNDLIPKMTDEQRHVYNVVLDSVNDNKGKIYFLYGYGGTGKIFVWKILSAAIRSQKNIVLNVASSGIASLLLPGGRTAHSRFKIPLTPHQTSTCNIKLGTELAELIALTKLIIWDEAPMMHKYCFEAHDRRLKDIMKVTDITNNDKPFRGKTIVFGGDFRQILPVIPKGRRHDVVIVSINTSYIWRNCEVLRLTKNMLLQSISSCDETRELSDFSKWIASIGDGTIGDVDDDTARVNIPNHMLIENLGDPIDSIVKAIYPDLHARIDDPTYLQERAILAPTLDVVDAINEYMINQMSGECRNYFSSNTACNSDSSADILSEVHTPKFLNLIKCSGVPNHELNLKIGTPIMLLRNLDPSLGLCNVTRLSITRLG